MNLTKNFTLAELTASNKAVELSLNEQFTPERRIVQNLTKLCTQILQPLRDKIGPVRITSGYRCPRLNDAVGGVKNSAHLQGLAADIAFNDEAHATLIIETLISVGAKRIGLNAKFIHVDIDYTKPHPAVFDYGNATPKWMQANRALWLKKMSNN
jgi:uncharacterized protein YcbK (DUF882 family)